MAEKKLAMERGRRGLIMKTLVRWRRLPSEGCFSVYVGDLRQRFVVRTVTVNHPLFRPLLEESEEVFGYAAVGPLQLPCDAAVFARVLEQIEEETAAAGNMAAAKRCGLATRGQPGYRILVPSRPINAGGRS
uniref:Uncharacterized protein n=1 Tax=Leersia perrieri TaxID=77586 RepID=A0A0D9XFG4_9ORYZ